MPYQSPLHILDSLQISPDDISPEVIIRLRQKLMSEFSLNSDITININGIDYTKDAILKVIDNLRETDNLILDKDIFRQKPLLNWLENPIKELFPNDLTVRILDKYNENDSTQSIIKEALIESIKFNFKKRQFAKITETLSCVTKLTEKYNLEIFELLNHEIQQVIELIRLARKSPNTSRDEGVFGFIATQDWTNLLNNLPAFFEKTRDSYCHSAIGYTLDVTEKSTEWTYQISHQVNQTLCNEELKSYISEYHAAFTENHNRFKTTKKLIPFIPIFIGIMVFAIIITTIFIVISKVNNSSNSSSPQTGEDVSRTLETGLSPAFSVYFKEVLNYQLSVKNEAKKVGGESIKVLSGDDPLPNLNLGNIGIKLDDNGDNLQTLNILNDTDFDMIIFNIGCKSRSYYIRSKSSIDIKFCNNNHVCFYFGKKWRQIYGKPLNNQDIENKRFQGYFLETHMNTNTVFEKIYTLKTSGFDILSIKYDNQCLDQLLAPFTEGIELVENN